MTNSDTSVQSSAVRIQDLGKTYPGASGPALSGVSLSVAPGEIVVLLGLSGSGKSTLLRHINGLETPTTGSVQSLGQEVTSLRGRDLRALRGRIGFIFQQFELVGALSVLENVLTGSLSTLRGPRVGVWSYPRALREKALGHIERVGLLDRTYQRADRLSGGQQQRVAIARALMQDPEILLADEPVASLDPESSSQVMGLIREIAAERGLTVVCSLHQVDLALSWGDRIVGLRGGEVVLDTRTDNLSREQVMEIYGRVATSTTEIAAVEVELAEAREQVLEQELRRAAVAQNTDRAGEDKA
ncbi:phosphonate ABC transporter ATP-binding protein [Microbacterium stercoris]|uniref:Phosphonate ABC transporter ATP-binding protein n=1 Tax=Microbacterium stercoris TaxID=2820289 RepID=A0A939TV99_9MICO|nr:phosphonate ABC transporter ATP-binding protein [Microbacterium stercoris]MBO3664874.1 phosphonate ABC transporter ATP-binding protein [Microbacterium stercoris]